MGPVEQVLEGKAAVYDDAFLERLCETYRRLEGEGADPQRIVRELADTDATAADALERALTGSGDPAATLREMAEAGPDRLRELRDAAVPDPGDTDPGGTDPGDTDPGGTGPGTTEHVEPAPAEGAAGHTVTLAQATAAYETAFAELYQEDPEVAGALAADPTLQQRLWEEAMASVNES